MMNTPRLLCLAIGLTTALLLLPSTVEACEAPPQNWTPEPREQTARRLYDESVTVFVGSVVSKTEETYQMRDASFEALRVSLLFTVADTLKGTPQETIIVKTGTGRGDCGLGHLFVEGATYVVYAGEYDANTLWVWRVVTEQDVPEEIDILQRLSSVRTGIGMPTAGENWHSSLLISVVIAVFALAMGLMVRRKA